MADTPTPMMQQYLALKQEAGDALLFYRMGDFFELFFDDARVASRVLDIALTTRGEHGGQPVPMCGVPVHSAEGYLAKLIRSGFKVAIAEQTETPAEAKARGGYKALVARDIIRYVTAGTLTEDNLLDARSDNVLVALAQVQGEIGLAAADISTGSFELTTISDAALDAELARLAELQAYLLDIAAQLIKPGGRVVYVTCSLLDEEGTGQFEAFLARHPQLQPQAMALPLGQARGQGIRLAPAHDGTDGFFIACAG